ncbi:aldehyde dehydrogenase [Gloeopeniophorella convolvens]|nr:aldehyde dehydrogenase [Gloeopeniophorella convolvens]
MSELKHTPVDEIATIYEALQTSFRAGVTRPLAWRKQQLLQLARMTSENSELIAKALAADLKKPLVEATSMEIAPIIGRSLKSAELLDEWAAPQKIDSVPDWQKPFNPTVLKSPKGVVLIIAPWNFPYMSLLEPLIGAIAAGCAAVIKPSEVSQHIAALLAELVPKYLDPSAFRVVNGAVPETTRLLELKWDHIFYTGNNQVARIIAAAAAKHLTPITLELGGKSPVIVDPSTTDLKVAAKRILWGKAVNAGQVCVAPDYILIPHAAQGAFIEALKEAAEEFFPQGALNSDSYGSIVSPNHYKRLTGILKRSTATIAFGGEVDGHSRIAPTIFRDVTEGDALLDGEIFGPLLPIVPIKDTAEAIAFINARPHALVLYAFTEDPKLKQALTDETRSGALIYNDIMYQLAVAELPFAGVGESGYGAQHLNYSFDAFTHERSTMDTPLAADPFLAARYQPFNAEKLGFFIASTPKIPDSI